MKTIYYAAQRYASHHRTARTYRRLLASRHRITRDLAEADLAILHGEPHNLPALFWRLPDLTSTYVIGYFVWEASDLPASYKQAMGYVHEVWTCSEYCRRIFARYHARVRRIPHAIARDRLCDDDDRRFIRAAIDHQPGDICFLCIARVRDLRKNVNILTEAFCATSEAMPDARLIVKARPDDPPFRRQHPRITYLPYDLTDAQMNALYELADAYVSTHHAEGWGLTIADAMLFGKPVIATRYSGNLEYTTDANAFLIDCTERAIDPRDCVAGFEPHMTWAHLEAADVARQLSAAYDSLRTSALTAILAQAQTTIARFSESAIRDLMIACLDEIPVGADRALRAR